MRSFRLWSGLSSSSLREERDQSRTAVSEDEWFETATVSVTLAGGQSIAMRMNVASVDFVEELETQRDLSESPHRTGNVSSQRILGSSLSSIAGCLRTLKYMDSWSQDAHEKVLAVKATKEDRRDT